MPKVTYRELISFVWQFMRLQKGTFALIFFLDSFAWSLDALIWPYILHQVIDIFTRFEGDRLAAWQALRWPMIQAACLVLYVEIASRTMGFLMAKAIPKLQAELRMAMFDHVQHHSPRYFNERLAGGLASQITDMTTQVELILQQLFWPILPALSACLLGSVVFWFVSPLFTWILLSWMVVHLGACLLFTRSCDSYEQRHGRAYNTLLGRMVDSLTNNFAVNLFYRFQHEKKVLASFQKEEEKSSIFARRYVEKMRCVLSSFYLIGIFLVMFGALVFSWIHGKISTGGLVQVFATMWSLSIILWTVGSAFPLLFQSFGRIREAYLVMRDPQDLGDQMGAEDLKVRSGEIVFDRVSFHYGEKKLFENKQVHIRGGEKVGLVGFTGSGKSTFINLILRFFPLESGRILIDGQDIAAATLESLRRQIALIPQDPLLFHRTLWENISYGKPETSPDLILKASKLAHCDQFIGRIPGGYEAKVGERGTKLSGGEKQRIAIARALLKDAPILILDEATSALDSVTERYIQDNLEKLMLGRTTLVIAHRLSTLLRMDRILVFDNGKIVEEGSPASLLETGGLYAKMWQMQSHGFLPDTPIWSI